jgi:hypothetical protein
MAQQLRAAGKAVALLVLFEPSLLGEPERGMPYSRHEEEPMGLRPLAARFASLLIQGHFGEIVQKVSYRCWSFMNLILLSLPLLRQIRRIPVSMRLLHASNSYRPRPYSEKVLAFFCPILAESDIGKVSLGQWQRNCSDFTVSHSSGLGFPRGDGHFMLFEEQHMVSLFARLSEYMDELESGAMNSDGIAENRIAAAAEGASPRP